MEHQYNQNQIGLKSIGELSGFKFFIPNYQRGYRWTKQQVSDLLNDINEFDTKKEHFYCLQPLVVKFRDEENTVWEVIDGQQRLTTIYIILTCLGENNPYSLEYETRKDSRDFLLNINQKDKNANIDYYHMAQAKETIDDWVEHVDKTAFLEKLKDKVKFIWYECVDEDPIKVFARLNIGKIGLTNSELIKALFLNSSNFTDKSNESVKLRQQEIASEWDKIEYTLQSEEFWLFLHDKGYNRPTRIDFIFDLICSQNALGKNKEDIGTDDYKTFRYFYEYFKVSDGSMLKAEKAWHEVKSYYQTFNEWFNDLELYHYVGFLAAGNKPIHQIVTAWNEYNSKKDFLLYLKNEIKNKIGKISTDFQYKEDGNDKGKCRPILLFHNIQTVINQNQAQLSNEKYKTSVFYKFPFHLYKLEGWDVEHINSSTSNTEEDDATREEWLVNIYLSADEKTQEKINSYFEANDNNTKKTLFQEIKKIFPKREEWTSEEKNRIWNYTLLDCSTNRSYGNSIFSAKRRIIIGKDQGKLIPIPKLKDGKILLGTEEKYATSSFVPPCTKQVFLKYFSSTVGDNNYWTKADAEAYKKDIERCLNMLNDNDKEEQQ